MWWTGDHGSFSSTLPGSQKVRSTTDHKMKTLLEHFFYQPESEDDLIQAILDPLAFTWILKKLKQNLRESCGECASTSTKRGVSSWQDVVA